MIKKILIAAALALVILTLLAGYTHILLPEEMDECQQDISHKGHLNELPAYHCIGHSEWNRTKDTWDHLHPWMDSAWHIANGYDASHAARKDTPLVE